MEAFLPTPSPDSFSSPALAAGGTATDDAPRESPAATVAVSPAPRASVCPPLRDAAPPHRAAPAGYRDEPTGQRASGEFADGPTAAEEALALAPLVWLDVTADDDSATLHSRLERANDALSALRSGELTGTAVLHV